MKNLSFTEEDIKIIAREMKKQGMYFVESSLPEKNGCVRVVDKNGTEKYVSIDDIFSSDLIKSFVMECPICDKIHEIEERKRTTKMTIKDQDIEYVEYYYFCANADDDENEFVTSEMMMQNLKRAKDAYQNVVKKI